MPNSADYPVESPCVGKCELNRASMCVGCGRTRTEIGQWSIVSTQRQAEIVAAAKKRLDERRVQESN